MFDPVSMLAILGPVLVDAGRAVVGRIIANDGIKPSSMAEVIQLRELDIRQFESMQTADSTGETYRWVEAIRKLQRPVVVLGLLVGFCINPDNVAIAASFQAVGWYLFGERTRSFVVGKK